MKTTNLKIGSLVAIMMLASVSVFAQPQRGPKGGQDEGEKAEKEKPTVEQIAEKQTERLANRLELTDAQKSKINDINVQFATKQAENRAEKQAERPEKGEGVKKEGARPSQIEMLAKRKEMMEKRMDQQMEAATAKREHLVSIMSVLNDGQKVDYALMIIEMQKDGPQAQKAPKRGGNDRGHQMRGGKKAPQRGGEQARGPQRGGDDERGPRKGGDNERGPRGGEPRGEKTAE